MPSIRLRKLEDDLPFGARVTGLTREQLRDEGIRKEICDLFEDCGLIVFEELEPSSEMQVAISNVIGPLKDHPLKEQPRVDQRSMPGVIEISADAEGGSIVELDGKPLITWQPWHFDHCYNDKLNRGAVLRAVEIPPELGFTGFADGIQLHRAVSPALRSQIEGKSIIYTLDLRYSQIRFGKPGTFRELRPSSTKIEEIAKTFPRAIHPAVWSRASGEKVLHVSPWGMVGIDGQENADGDSLLEALCAEQDEKIVSYYHRWKPTDMLLWDNWRMLHAAGGCDPKYRRVMHRTTIEGDYGLGHFENGRARGAL